jgi:Fe-S-cluster containining protein
MPSTTSCRENASGTDVRYACQRCTNCCRWPGFVKLTDADITAIAAFLGMNEHAFIEKFTRLRPRRDGLALIDNPDESCVFLEGRDCRIQPVKPVQCSGFPNTWNFPGWRDVCEAIEVPVKTGFAE